jgi:hypothetical protein
MEKKLYQSKTVLLSALLGVFAIIHSLGFLPGVDVWMQSHQDVILMGLSALGVGLRLISSGKIVIE